MVEAKILPEDIIAQVKKSRQRAKSYYAEVKINLYRDDVIIKECDMREWVKLADGKVKRRAEVHSENDDMTVLINDGDRFIEYHKKDKEVLTSNLIANLDKNLIEDPKDHTIKVLQSLNITHDVQSPAEVNLNGMRTYYIKAIPKGQDGIASSKEYWIDRATWLVIKSANYSGNTRYVKEYTKIEFLSDIDEALFVEELPGDVKIIDLDAGFDEKVVNFDKAIRFFGKSILYVPEELGFELCETKMITGCVQRDYLIQEYGNGNDISFSIHLRKIDKDKNNRLPKEDDINLRGKAGTYIDGNIKMIRFDEDGLTYTFLIKDASITIDEGIKIIENMVPYSA